MPHLVTSIWVLVRVVFFCQFPICLKKHEEEVLANIIIIVSMFVCWNQTPA